MFKTFFSFSNFSLKGVGLSNFCMLGRSAHWWSDPTPPQVQWIKYAQFRLITTTSYT